MLALFVGQLALAGRDPWFYKSQKKFVPVGRGIAQAADHAGDKSPEEIKAIVGKAQVDWARCLDVDTRIYKATQLVAGLLGKDVVLKQMTDMAIKDHFHDAKAFLEQLQAVEAPLEADVGAEDGAAFPVKYLRFLKEKSKDNKALEELVGNINEASLDECGIEELAPEFVEIQNAKFADKLNEAKLTTPEGLMEFYRQEVAKVRARLATKEIALSNPEYWYFAEGGFSSLILSRIFEMTSKEPEEFYNETSKTDLNLYSLAVNASKDDLFQIGEFVDGASKAAKVEAEFYIKKLQEAADEKKAVLTKEQNRFLEEAIQESQALRKSLK